MRVQFPAIIGKLGFDERLLHSSSFANINSICLAVSAYFLSKNNASSEVACAYKMMADEVMKDSDLTTDEKIERCSKIAAEMEKAQSKRQDEQVRRLDEHEINRGKIACDVVAGVFTGGIYTFAKLVNSSVQCRKNEDNVIEFAKEA